MDYGIERIASTDCALDHIPGITRVDPLTSEKTQPGSATSEDGVQQFIHSHADIWLRRVEAVREEH